MDPAVAALLKRSVRASGVPVTVKDNAALKAVANTVRVARANRESA